MPQRKEKNEAQPHALPASESFMTWEIVAGIFTMLASFIAVVSAAVKINRAIVLLEAAVKELKKQTQTQEDQNKRTSEKLDRIDRRVIRLETKNTSRRTWDQPL